MRYHWGLGVGHAYSHDRDVLLQKYSTTSSTCEADGPEEEDTSGSSAPSQADNVSGDAGGSEKQNELERNERLHVSEPEDESSANARAVNDEADASGDSSSDSESGSSDSSDDREDFNNEERLELYHTYSPK